MFTLVETHPITGNEPPNFLHKQGILFWRGVHLSSCAKAAVFIVDGIVMGFTRYSRLSDEHLHYEGTWVHSKYRGMGYGKRLWNLSIEHEKPSIISVAAMSDEGWYLIKSVQKQWLDIKFIIRDQRPEDVFNVAC